MFSHKQVWAAIDTIAERYGYSPSGLAKKSGLDPTSFNPSKRNGPDGRPRWPTMESISRVLNAAGATVEEFMDLLSGRKGQAPRLKQIPMLGFAKAGKGGFFDDSGFPAGNGWEEIDVPGVTDTTAYALEITGDSMKPAYRDGDVIIVSPAASIRPAKSRPIVTGKWNLKLLVSIPAAIFQSKALIEAATTRTRTRSSPKCLIAARTSSTARAPLLAWVTR